MNSKNLPLKFTLFVALPIALCIWTLVWGNKVKQGIDLRGGHSLIFELRSNAKEREQLEAQAKDLQTQLAAATDDAKKKELKGKLDQLNERISGLSDSAEQSNLPEQIIGILKERIDKQGLLSLEWRPLGRNRIEVRMPAASKEAQDAKNAYLDALDKLEAGNLQPSKLRRVLESAGPARAAEIKAIAIDDDQAKLLDGLAAQRDTVNQAQAAYDQLKNTAASRPTTQGSALDDQINAARDALDAARIKYDSAWDKLQQSNINVQALQGVLKLYVSPAEAKAIGKDEATNRTTRFTEGLDALKTKHPTRAQQITKLFDLYCNWVDSRKTLDDPADLKRLIAKAGVLTFRIGPYASGSENALSQDVANSYRRDLQENGPDAGRRRNDSLQWFPIRGTRESFGGLVTDDWNGQSYVLLYNTSENTMLQQRGAEAWRLADAYPESDQMGRPAVGFRFDERGAQKFYRLTSTHIKQLMAILLDDEVYSAPVINSGISDRGIIEGTFTRDDVNDLVRILKAGSLPARLNPNPVSESTFGPSLGQENLNLALKAGYWSMAVVVGFMVIYYLIAGFVADFAMAVNILFMLGAMSMMGAVFTLPGIAGVILSIGMAVDANVLIYERLREEQDKGQSVRMAMKNAYERAFSAIFDSNITTLLTCAILFWVGTEEVKGFAITLGLGVLFNLFTAVTVTRWIFQAMLERGLVKTKFRMLRLIGVPNIDWMSKRYYFWGFSLATGILGLISLFIQGKDIWGIEFSSGTKAIVRFKDDALLTSSSKMALPNDLLVNEAIISTARAKNFNKLADTARVEKLIDRDRVANFFHEHFRDEKLFPDVQAKGITAAQWKQAHLNEQAFNLLDPNHDGVLTVQELNDNLPTNAYQLATTDTSVDHIREVARDAFGSALVNRTAHQFTLAQGIRLENLGVDVAPDGMTPINRKMIQSADKSIHDELADCEGGVMFVVQDIKPALSRAELTQRIREMRFQPDFAEQSLNPINVLPLTPAGEDTYSSFVVLAKSAEATGNDDRAMAGFATGERKLLSESLAREEAMETTNFDPAIAGETAQRAVMALVLGWLAIIAYLWFRFGSAKWGFAAVICLVHDVTIIVGLVAASDWIYNTWFGKALMIDSFKIDLTMIAALLTIIGYSVNDTIVVFDRIRENRGKLATVTPQLINSSINQTLSRTLLTSSTVFVVVLIMYVAGGPGIHAFNYALLAGVFFGTYSSIAVAAPLLLGFKGALIRKTLQSETEAK